MKKSFYSIMAGAYLSLASVFTLQAQCLSGGSQRSAGGITYPAPSPGQTFSNPQSLQQLDWDLYSLPGNGNQYTFKSIECIYNTYNGQFSCTDNSYYYTNMTITVPGKSGDSVIATGTSPLTILVAKPTVVKVRSHFHVNCGTITISGSYKLLQTLTTTSCNWYRDADGDGYGNPTIDSSNCNVSSIPGYVSNNLDCNDNSKNATLVLKYFPDHDNDGFGKLGSVPQSSCGTPSSYRLASSGATFSTDSTDCDDTNPNVYPGATEVDGDNIDANCDGSDGINNGLSFDGVDDNIVAPILDLSANNTMSIEAWIKPMDITSTTYSEITRQNSNGAPNWLFSFQDNGTHLSFGLQTGTTDYTELDATINPSYFTDGKWHHVAAVYDGTNKYVYVDGSVIGTEAHTGNVTAGGVAHNIGASGGSEFFNGTLDELRIWNKALTLLDIQASIAKEKPTTKSGLVLHYDFNQGIANGNNTTITSVVNDSASTKNGTLSNFALTGNISNFVTGAPFVFVPAVITGTQNESIANASVSIYPNPTNGTFSIASTSELGSVTVFNSVGSVVYQNTVAAKQVNIELFSKEAGVYFVKVGNKMTKLIRE